jgi:predicted TIM-barrel fold metal-dependent hydrolase
MATSNLSCANTTAGLNHKLRYGFVGVKVYPQMGWRPSGNQPRIGLSDSDAAELDRVVDDLFTWCEAEHVPITAHCADSNYADPLFVGFGGPDDWIPVLRRYPALHINLGHFGGDVKDGATDGWPWKIARAAGESPGLFADVGNRRVDDDAVAAAYFDMLAHMWVTPATAAMADRLMYGSDWYMLAINPEHNQFLARYRDLYTDRFGVERAAGFLGGNALSFLGFNNASNRNAQRLFARYQRFAPDHVPAWLAR